MVKYIRNVTFGFWTVWLISWLATSLSFAQTDVCSTGTAIPPFLDAGADPNLLMVLDNSGSMLDMAYTPEDSNSCFDDTYLNASVTSYAGYYERDAWYEWSNEFDPSVSPETAALDCDFITAGTQQCRKWEPGGEYADAELILENGIYYRADCDGDASCFASNVDLIRNDSGINWLRADGVLVWSDEGDGFKAGEFIRRKDQLYLALTDNYSATDPNTGLPIDAIDPPDPANVPLQDDPVWDVWKLMDHTWIPGEYYDLGDFVSYQGMTFQAIDDVTAGNISPFYDRVGDDIFDGTPLWQRMDGHWAKTTTPCPAPSFTFTRFDEDGDRVTDPSSPADPNYPYDMKITMYAGTTKIDYTNYDSTLQADAVTCFAARGNYVNWASASKFDIQKEILTGGKYSAGYEKPLEAKSDTGTPLGVPLYDADGQPVPDNEYTEGTGVAGVTGDTYDDRLISESRGCAGSNYIKQIPIWDPSTTTEEDKSNKETSVTTLTMRVRGAAKEDWVNPGDDTTRIEIMGLSGSGGFNVDACNQAIKEMIAIMETGQGGPSFSHDVDVCLGVDTTNYNPALNHAMQYCAFSWRTDPKVVPRDLNAVVGDCSKYYQTSDPGAIDPVEDAYVCNGIFDALLNHDKRFGFDDARAGYIGRCFETDGGGASTCDYYPKDPDDCVWPTGGNKEGECTFTIGTLLLKNRENYPYTEFYCDEDQGLPETLGCKKNKWDTYRIDSVSDAQCNPDNSIYLTGGGWSSVLYPAGINFSFTLDEQAIIDKGNHIKNEFDEDVKLLPDEAWWCIYQASEDYCSDVNVAEVIDPSDILSTTGELFNIPATLIDAGVIAQLGTDRPLATFKGYIKYDLPVNHDSDPENKDSIGEFQGDSFERPDGPRNILFDVAEQYDLRLGVMAFNDVGSATECDDLEAKCVTEDDGSYRVCNEAAVCDENDAECITAKADCTECELSRNIDQFCPRDGSNKDGARVIAQINKGLVKDTKETPEPEDDTEDWSHYVKLVAAINDTKATSWTPLAEAIHNAFGYYGQNTALRINTPNDLTNTNTCNKLGSGEYVVCNDDPSNAAYNQVDCDYCQQSADFYTKLEDPDNWDDPVEYWCQENNILVITEGASTADTRNVTGFTGFQGDFATTGDGDILCPGGLEGSTHLDDLTYFGQHTTVEGNSETSSYLYSALLPKEVDEFDQAKAGTEWAKQPISTYIVTTGSQDQTQTGECTPWGLMTSATINGGTQLLYGENPDGLKARLQEAFAGIAQRASAGSAASVISSSRSGEGAIYQAVFWPEIPRGFDEDPLVWAGDVHGLFIDSYGRMWDDYDGNGILSSEDLDGNGINGTDFNGDFTLQDDPYSEDANDNGKLDFGEDLNGNKQLDLALDETPDNNGYFENATSNCLAGDRRIFYKFDGDNTSICFNESCTDNYSDCPGVQTPQLLADFDSYLWSARTQLGGISTAILDQNRNVGADKLWNWGADDPNYPTRYIFTWNDLNNNGIVDSDGSGDRNDEIIELESHFGVDDTYWTRYRAAASGTDADPTPTNLDYLHHFLLDDFRIEGATDNERSYEMNLFIEWLRGSDNQFEPANNDINGNQVRDYVYRCRKYSSDITNPQGCYDAFDQQGNPTGTTNNPEWRLGDVIHSTPKLVGQPAEAFHTIYRDPTYAEFYQRYRYRRGVVYFGANDGMLHAVNAGFYDSEIDRFWRNREIPDPTLAGFTYDDNGPPLGTELWAYVPYNIQPHLMKLADPGYVDYHEYFVDKEPRIFDMKIFQEEDECTTEGPYSEQCIHPGGWGTILVGAMRFGGHPIVVADHDDNPNGWWSPTSDGAVDNRKFISAYFILDITDPERPPKLLGEMTSTTEEIETATGSGIYKPKYADLGFSLPTPTGVVMHDVDPGDLNSDRYFWYLLFGSGPTGYNPDILGGENEEQGKIAVLPMTWLDGDNPTVPASNVRRPFRIPNADPPAGDFSGGGRILIQEYTYPDPTDLTNRVLIPGSDKESFLSDLITADLDVQTETSPKFGGLYKSDAVYFGTVDGTGFAGSPGSTIWNGNGRVFRLVMRDTDRLNSTVPGIQKSTPPSDWSLHKLMATNGPVSGAPSLGWDGANYWIYYGTGRFFSTKDKTDNTVQHFFGVKEPLDSGCEMTWAEIDWDGTQNLDVGGQALVVPFGINKRGLVRSDYIRVIEDQSLTVQGEPVVFCDAVSPDCDLDFLDDISPLAKFNGLKSFNELKEYIAGEPRGTSGVDDCAFTPPTTTPATPPTGVDGWYRVLRDERERVVGQSTLLGGLVTFTSYQPNKDLCTPEGYSFLYGVHYQTGTAWYENVFGLTGGYYSVDGLDRPVVNERYEMGRGLATTPSLHTGTGDGADAKAIIQTSTGEIIEIDQENLPIKPPRSGRILWSDESE